MSPALPLVRRWAVDWLNSHDPSVLPDLLDDDYVLSIGTSEFRGRTAYEKAARGQLEQFPGLGLTVHDVMASGDRAAVRFTEHGASVRHGGRVAAWAGIALFRCRHARLVTTWAEEDYASRRRQLGSGDPHSVEAPHPAPWDVPEEAPDPRAEDAVAKLLASGLHDLPEGVLTDDQSPGRRPLTVPLSGSPRVDEIFSAGSRVAFHVTAAVAGDGGEGSASLGMAGIVTVEGGAVVGGHVVRDLLGAGAVPPDRE